MKGQRRVRRGIGHGREGDNRNAPEFFESNGNLYAIGSLGGVKVDIGGSLD